MLALTAACTHVRPGDAGAAPRRAPSVEPVPSAAPIAHPLHSPYETVDAGGVQALVPRKWEATALLGDGILRQGLVASPDPDSWEELDGSVPGLEVSWVDRELVGIPSDLYYLAASGPAIPGLVSADWCRREHVAVLLNHQPFADDPSSPGDYVERGSGYCHRQGHVTRWAYFVAAPGFGPLRNIGIASSGLYVTVAVVADSPTARERLHTMVRSAQYGTASVAQLLKVARLSARLG